ncbi:hypothetical protein H1C71_037687, partial [Ictidomys tridecemlineatus]
LGLVLRRAEADWPSRKASPHPGSPGGGRPGEAEVGEESAGVGGMGGQVGLGGLGMMHALDSQGCPLGHQQGSLRSWGSTKGTTNWKEEEFLEVEEGETHHPQALRLLLHKRRGPTGGLVCPTPQPGAGFLEGTVPTFGGYRGRCRTKKP